MLKEERDKVTRSIYGLDVCAPKIYNVEALTPNMTVFEDLWSVRR